MAAPSSSSSSFAFKLQDATVEAERLGELFLINREQVGATPKPACARANTAADADADADSNADAHPHLNPKTPNTTKTDGRDGQAAAGHARGAERPQAAVPAAPKTTAKGVAAARRGGRRRGRRRHRCRLCLRLGLNSRIRGFPPGVRHDLVLRALPVGRRRAVARGRCVFPFGVVGGVGVRACFSRRRRRSSPLLTHLPRAQPDTQQHNTTELASLDARLESLRAEQKRLTARLADLGAAPRTAALDAHVRLRG
jgi:hypothetical protein